MTIKGEEVRIKVESLRNKIELKFEEIYESLNEVKEDIVTKFENYWEKYLDNFGECSSALEEKIGHFDQILEQISNIQQEVKI